MILHSLLSKEEPDPLSRILLIDINTRRLPSMGIFLCGVALRGRIHVLVAKRIDNQINIAGGLV